MSDTKATNPKDAIANDKLPLHLVPDTLDIYAAAAFAEGDSKYGGYNWRIAGVRASVYYSALMRHMKKWWNGQWADPKTQVPHLANAVACLGIIVDAIETDKLVDDRPPSVILDSVIGDMESSIKFVRNVNADKNPRRYTIDDTPPATEPNQPEPTFQVSDPIGVRQVEHRDLRFEVGPDSIVAFVDDAAPTRTVTEDHGEWSEDATHAEHKLRRFYDAVIHNKPSDADRLIREVANHVAAIIAARAQ